MLLPTNLKGDFFLKLYPKRPDNITRSAFREVPNNHMNLFNIRYFVLCNSSSLGPIVYDAKSYKKKKYVKLLLKVLYNVVVL